MTPIFNTSWEYPRVHVWSKFGGSSSNLWWVTVQKRQSLQTDRHTDRQTEATTMPLRPESPRGKNAFENVICKMAAILFRPQWVQAKLCSTKCVCILQVKNMYAKCLHSMLEWQWGQYKNQQILSTQHTEARTKQNGPHFADDFHKSIFLQIFVFWYMNFTEVYS